MNAVLRSPTKWLSLPKAGNRPEENEDASKVVYSHTGMSIHSRRATVAVSDGASESAFAREWANDLATVFVQCPPDLCELTEHSLNRWLASVQEEWRAGIPWDRLPWHGEAKARAGAFATLLGLTIGVVPDSSRQLIWQAVAIGDSCLFVVRDDHLKVSFPIKNAAQFDNTPSLVCSNPANDAGMWEAVQLRSGECEPGDRIILASDALACWFLSTSAAGGKPWETLLSLGGQSRWNEWVEEHRRAGLLRNDDTTLVIIEVVKGPF